MTARHKALLWIACASFFPAAQAQFIQQGNKLVGTNGAGAEQGDGGQAVALSADGNTAIVGGVRDNGTIGAAWVFTRSAGVWSQQGNKLVGTNAVAESSQGVAVALSADGNTAIVGGYTDNRGIGAAWVFTRSGGLWTQQGPKLVGTGAVGLASQGDGVALSADGNTALIGGFSDNNYMGAVWVWTRSGGVWTQQGSKLVGAGAAGPARQGAVAISGDGMTALVAGPGDGGFPTGLGAVWVWTQSGGVWTQQGNKLVSPTATVTPQEGRGLALSTDGNTALIASRDALRVWTRAAGVWTQQAGPLAGTGTVGSFGVDSVSISGDGNTAVVGDSADNTFAGAVWVWKRSGAAWTQLGGKLFGTGGVVPSSDNLFQGTSVAISADGNTILEAGSGDSGNTGAAWIFVNQAALPSTPAPATLLLTLTGLAALLLLFRYIFPVP